MHISDQENDDRIREIKRLRSENAQLCEVNEEQARRIRDICEQGDARGGGIVVAFIVVSAACIGIGLWIGYLLCH